MRTGIYIHIPFCKSRCIYCGFYSTTLGDEWRGRYVDAITREMQMRAQEFDEIGAPDNHATIDTIYIGGGTPSTLMPQEVMKIIERAVVCYPGIPREITMEVNPDDVSKEYIAAVHNCGVNRISMGVQTFDDARLRFIHRRHSALQAECAVDAIRQAGISNISIDLMFGFPGETLAEWHDDLCHAVSLAPEHISAYSLMYEEGTTLQRMLNEGKVAVTDDDTYLAMYTDLIDTLAVNGYEQYEISNFARNGHRSIHNSSYWHDTPYMGFGAAAHSYVNRTRSWNIADIKEYIRSIESGKLMFESEHIDDNTHYDDLVTTAMRTREGLDLKILPATYSDYAMRCAQKHIDAGLLETSDGHLRLTRRGLFVSDMVMSDLMMV